MDAVSSPCLSEDDSIESIIDVCNKLYHLWWSVLVCQGEGWLLAGRKVMTYTPNALARSRSVIMLFIRKDACFLQDKKCQSKSYYLNTMFAGK